MHKKLWFLNPAVLFLLGSIQALFPYFIWYFFGKNPNYEYEVSFSPLVLWFFGYCAFFIGCKIINKKSKYENKIYFIDKNRFDKLKYFLLISYVLCLFIMVKEYNGLPILDFIYGIVNVNDVNDIQSTSNSSIFGLFYSIQTCFLILISQGIGFSLINRKLNINLLIYLALIFFGSFISGKRQGAVIITSVFLTSFLIYAGYMKDYILARRLFRMATFYGILFLVLFIPLFGLIGSLRSGSNLGDGVTQLFTYLDFPLINFEWQCEEFGLFRGANNWAPFFSSMVPYKLIANTNLFFDSYDQIYNFSYPEPGIGAGYFGNVHLALGFLGVLVYGFITGIFCKKIFLLAISNIQWVVPYGLITWPLLSAHSYAHFNNLIFFPLPFLLSVAIAKFTVKIKQ